MLSSGLVLQMFDVYMTILECIVLQADPLGVGAYSNSYLLYLARVVLEPAVNDGYVLGLSADIDPDPDAGFFRAVIADNAVLDPVSIAAAELRVFGAKEYSHLAVSFDSAVSDEIIRVAVSDAYAESFILRKYAVLHNAV